jgi:hypothetical protein
MLYFGFCKCATRCLKANDSLFFSPPITKFPKGVCSCLVAFAKNAATLPLDGAVAAVGIEFASADSTSRLKSRSNFSPPEGLGFEAAGLAGFLQE